MLILKAMMKSALFQGNFQRVCGRCEQIFAKNEAFPFGACSVKVVLTYSRARQTPLKVGKVLALFWQSLNAGGTAENCFSVPILN